MAAATLMGVGGLAMSGYQMYQGQKNKKAAERAMRNYERQDLVNPYEDMQISTAGTDLMREETGRATASLVDAGRNAGIRGIYGNLPKVVAYNNQSNMETRAYLDDQIQKRDYAIAGDETAIRDINEARDTANLAGIGQQMEVGRQDLWSGIRGMGASAMYVANAFDEKRGKSNSGNKNYFPGNQMPSSIGWQQNGYYNIPTIKQGF